MTSNLDELANTKALSPNDAYRQLVLTTAVFPGSGQSQSLDGINYCVVSLAGEAGELANCWKKYLRIRDKADESDRAEAIRKMMDELGDVLWYVFALAAQFNVSIEQIMEWNANKILQRKAAGTIAATETRKE